MDDLNIYFRSGLKDSDLNRFLQAQTCVEGSIMLIFNLTLFTNG